MKDAPTVQVYGAGRTGLAVARLAAQRGVTVAGLWNRSPLQPPREALAKGLPLTVASRPGPAAADLWIVAVSDDAIVEVAESLAAALGDSGAPRPRAVAHCAGARPAADLEALRRTGIPSGSWHPAMTFRGADSDAEALAGSCVAVEGDAEAQSILAAFSQALGLVWHPLAADHKLRYHGALVLASNGRVALDGAARRLLADAALDDITARRVLAPLVARTEQNLRVSEPVDTLTGPVARGDSETVRATLASLRDRPNIERLYRAVAAVALSIVPRGIRGDGHRAVADLIGMEERDQW